MWARELALKSGLNVPNTAAEHYYLITDTIEGLGPDTPVFEDPAAHGYYREEGGGMMVGLFEPRAAAWHPEGVPAGSSFTTLKPDWDRMGPFLETAMSRVPVTLEAGVRTFFCGPESFTPDLSPIVGEAPGTRGYFVAAGMNSVGVLSAGGLGRVVAQWIVDGKPDVDVTGFDVDRFRAYQAEESYRATRTTEILGTVYAAHTPGKQLYSARGAKLSPVHDRLVANGGYLREVSGWEGADWFAGPGVTPEATPTWGHADWFPRWEAEHRAVREGAGLMDMSFMTKLRVTGADAGRVLDHVSAGAVDGEAERITYTQWLDPDGKLQADLTVTKLADDDFWVVASDTAHGHVLAWLARHIGGADVTIEDVTEDWAQLNVQGPRSRDLLATLTDADLSTEAFPFRTARFVTLAGVRVLLVRITYVGELGYELYLPAADALAVYDAVAAAGATPVGLKTLASCRMEKGYRDFGHDIDNTDNVIEVGLGFAVDLDKPNFIGKDAVAAHQGRGRPAPPAGPGPAHRPRAGAAPRRAGAARRRGGRLRPRRVVRLDPRRRRRSRPARRRRAADRRLDQGRHVDGRRRRHGARRRGVAAADVRPDERAHQGLTRRPRARPRLQRGRGRAAAGPRAARTSLSPSRGSGPGPTCSGSTTTRRATTTGDCG